MLYKLYLKTIKKSRLLLYSYPLFKKSHMQNVTLSSKVLSFHRNKKFNMELSLWSYRPEFGLGWKHFIT